ncbi:NUDIX hydrolase [Stakelama marina]|uniref:NUDIX domain-containing protein n=1 Tax=Stakelama marina TaxID=2826939 RepID=A0A8T4IN63_9SPHN|nr:NUDIX domain-containing protein [Stakelama marina]MBR0553606.1 NUDIX domain-containing protein [Stakelama marina]
MADHAISDPIPAATVVVMRDRKAAPPQLLFVERARAMAFAGGAIVFPGGRIDPGDHALAAMVQGVGEDAPARIAAIRETIEEAGIAVGMRDVPRPAEIKRMRAALHGGDAFGSVLDGGARAFDMNALVPFARWCPNMAHARIFDTRFYLARLPDDAPEPEVDETENVRAFWASAQEVLAAADRGDAHIIFPTRRNLERLAMFASFADAVADARAHEIRTITPWIEERGGERHLCIPDDLGYPTISEPVSSAFRG